MSAFALKIVTPDGLLFDGQAEELIVRTQTGDVAILPGHIDYVAPLGMGCAAVVSGGVRRTAACIGGMLSVSGGKVTLVPTTFEWAEDIDLARAQASASRANAALKAHKDDAELRLAQSRLRRSLVRQSVAQSLGRN